MPILEFFDINQNPQKYDFTEISLCRLAALYIFFRETSQNDDTSDEIRINANAFVANFQALQGIMNTLVTTTCSFVEKSTVTKHDIIVAEIEIETDINTMGGVLHKLTNEVTEEKLQLLLGSANQYLVDNIISDLKMLFDIIKNQKAKIMNVILSHQGLLDYIQSMQAEMGFLYQLRDFLNIYVIELDQKPINSLPGTVVDTVRELTRVGADLTGTLFGIATRATGLEWSATRRAEDWLKSWNDKHKPLSHRSYKYTAS